MSHKTQLAIKWMLDRVVAAAVGLALTPLLLAIAFAIRLDDGPPVLFYQERLGKAARRFGIIKFRTMRVDADRMLDSEGRVAANRITRVGKVLRFLSLDELPQLVNILRGEMSFIGPRPVLPEHWQRYTARQKGRFAMKPGITGLAQVKGRNTLPWSQRIELDLQYIDRFSLWLDCRILASTVRAVIFRHGIILDRNPDEVDDLPPPAREEETVGMRSMQDDAGSGQLRSDEDDAKESGS